MTSLPMVAQTLDHTCGAACFESMFRFFRGSSPGEMHFARELGALDLGYTPPKNVADLAIHYGFHCEFIERSDISTLAQFVSEGWVVFITWWDEDAGHYGLVRSLDKNSVLLMDPWTARENRDNLLPLDYFEQNWQARGGLIVAVRNSPTDARPLDS